MAPKSSSDRLLIEEANARFWSQTGYKPGQKLDPANAQDRAMMSIWSKLFSAVKAEDKAGNLVFSYGRPEVKQAIQDAGVASRAAAVHAEAGAMSQTPEDVISNARAAAVAQQIASKRAQDAARAQPASLTPRDLQGAADAANVASANAPSPAGADQVARAQVNAKATANEDPRVREVRTKITQLARRKFRGSMPALFRHYAPSGFGTIDAVKRLVSDAGIGNVVTQGYWADGIMARIDRNRDGRISAAEFDAVINPIGARPVRLPAPRPVQQLPGPPAPLPHEAAAPTPEAASSEEVVEETVAAPSGVNFKKVAVIGAAVAGGAILLALVSRPSAQVTKIIKVSPKKAYA